MNSFQPNQTEPLINEDQILQQEFTKKHLVTYVVFAFIAIIVSFTGSFFLNEYLNNPTENSKSEVVITPAQPEINQDSNIETTTETKIKNEVEKKSEELLTYTDSVAKFSLQYPKTWNLDTINETTTQTDANNITIHSGAILLSTETQAVSIIFGDGFGGAPCGEPETYLENGVEITLPIAGKPILFCQIVSPNRGSKTIQAYETDNSCGSCSPIENKNILDGTSFVIKIISNTPDIQSEEIGEIIKSFSLLE